MLSIDRSGSYRFDDAGRLAEAHVTPAELVVYASYFVPARTPPVALRIDQPSPGPGCPL